MASEEAQSRALYYREIKLKYETEAPMLKYRLKNIKKRFVVSCIKDEAKLRKEIKRHINNGGK